MRAFYPPDRARKTYPNFRSGTRAEPRQRQRMIEWKTQGRQVRGVLHERLQAKAFGASLCFPHNLLIGTFLKNVLLSDQIRDRILAGQSGTTVYGIKASVLKEIKVPVPPLATQQAIVAEIEAEQALVARRATAILAVLGHGQDGRGTRRRRKRKFLAKKTRIYGIAMQTCSVGPRLFLAHGCAT